MARAVNLSRTARQSITVNNVPGYHHVITVTSAVGLDKYIFRKRQRPLDPIAQTTTSDFDGVCTPVDLQDLPVNAPNPPNVLFRVDNIDVFYPTQDEGLDEWDAIQAAIQLLLDRLAADDALAITENLTISD